MTIKNGDSNGNGETDHYLRPGNINNNNFPGVREDPSESFEAAIDPLDSAQITLGQRIWFKIPPGNTTTTTTIKASSSFLKFLERFTPIDETARALFKDFNGTYDTLFVSGRVQFYDTIGKSADQDNFLRIGVVIDSFDKFVCCCCRLLKSPSSGASLPPRGTFLRPGSTSESEEYLRLAVYNYCLSSGCDGTYLPNNGNNKGRRLSPPSHSLDRGNCGGSGTLMKSGTRQISSLNGKFFDCSQGHGFYLKTGQVYSDPLGNDSSSALKPSNSTMRNCFVSTNSFDSTISNPTVQEPIEMTSKSSRNLIIKNIPDAASTNTLIPQPLRSPFPLPPHSQDEGGEDVSSLSSFSSSLTTPMGGAGLAENLTDSQPAQNHENEAPRLNDETQSHTLPQPAPPNLCIGDRVAIHSSADPVAANKSTGNNNSDRLTSSVKGSKTLHSNFSSIASGIDQFLLRSDSLTSLNSATSAVTFNSHRKQQAGSKTGRNSALKIGTVRYIGPIEVSDGIWVGVELDLNVGKNDGRIKEKRYFKCAPNRGLFARIERIVKLSAEAEPLHEFKRRLSVKGMPAIAQSLIMNPGRRESSGAIFNYPNMNSLKKAAASNSTNKMAAAPSNLSSKMSTSTLQLTRKHRADSQESLTSEASFMSLKSRAANHQHHTGVNHHNSCLKNGRLPPLPILSPPFIGGMNDIKGLTTGDSVATVQDGGAVGASGVRACKSCASSTVADLHTTMKLRFEIDRYKRLHGSQQGEMTRLSTLLNEREEELENFKKEFANFKSKSEAQISNLFGQIEDFEKQNEDLENKLTEEKLKCENFQFQVEEFSILAQEKSSLESPSNERHNEMEFEQEGINQEIFVDVSNPEITSDKDVLKQKDDELSELYTENLHIKSQLQKFEAEWIKGSQERQNLSLANDELLGKLTSQQLENTKLNESLQRAKKEYEIEIRALTLKETTSKVECLEEYTGKVNELKLELANKQECLETLKIQSDSMKKSAEEQFNKMKSQWRLALDDVANWQVKYNETLNKNEKLTNEIELSRRQSEIRCDHLRATFLAEVEAKVQMESQKLTIEHLKKENSSLNKVNELEKLVNSYQENFTNLNQQMDTLRQNYEMKEIELQKFLELNFALGESFKSAQSDLDKLHDKFENLNRDHKELEGDLENTKAILAEKDDVIEDTRREKNDIEKEYEELRAKLRSGLLVDLINIPNTNFKEALKNPHVDNGIGDFKDFKNSLNFVDTVKTEGLAQIHKQCHEKQIFLNDVIIDMNEQLNKLHSRIKDMEIHKGDKVLRSLIGSDGYEDTDFGNLRISQDNLTESSDSGSNTRIGGNNRLSRSRLSQSLLVADHNQNNINNNRYKRNTENVSKINISLDGNDLNNASNNNDHTSPRKYRNTLHHTPADLLFDSIATRASTKCKKDRVRSYCDNCEIFDAHDTANCRPHRHNPSNTVEGPNKSLLSDGEGDDKTHHSSKQLAKSTSNRLDDEKSVFISPKHQIRKTPREYCDNCEAFGHETVNCDKLPITQILPTSIKVSDFYI